EEASGDDAAGDTLTSIENLTGGDFDDTLTGDAGANVINGGDGNDTIEGGAGPDTITGGADTDTASYANSAAWVAVDLANAPDNLGDAAGDTFTDIEDLTGSAHDDSLLGNESANTLRGGDGDDALTGRGGADHLIGGAGIDTATYGNSAVGAVNV